MTSTQFPLPATSYPLSFQAIAASFALPKKSSPLESSKSSLFLQNTRGGGTPTNRSFGINNFQPLFPRPVCKAVTPAANRALSPCPAPAPAPARSARLRSKPLRDLVRCTEAQKCLSVSPLLATLTHSLSRKSFPCHSYANTWDRGVTIAPIYSHGDFSRHSSLFLPPFVLCAPEGFTARAWLAKIYFFSAAF